MGKEKHLRRKRSPGIYLFVGMYFFEKIIAQLPCGMMDRDFINAIGLTSTQSIIKNFRDIYYLNFIAVPTTIFLMYPASQKTNHNC